jgi:predicted negative regulator of RcsB-dependent stress response
MRNNFGKFVPLTLVLLFSFGCASLPPVNFSVPNIGVSSTKLDAELKSLTVSIASPDEDAGEIDPGIGIHTGSWKTALEEAFNKMAIFKDDSPRKVTLAVKILKFDTPSFGAGMTTHTSARYEIIDRSDGSIIFTTDISTSGVVPFDYAFNGLVRIHESINRSVQNNIIEFVQHFQTHAKTNIPAIEKLDQDYHGDMQKKVQQSPISSDQKTAWYTAIQKLEAGNQFQKNGAYDKAIENFQQALTLFRKIGAEEWIATSLGNIGNVYNSRGQYDKAIENYQQALTIARKLGSENMVSKSLMNIEKAKKNIILKEAKE